MSMEKRNLIEEGRTPAIDKQAAADLFEKNAVGAFKEPPAFVTKPADRIAERQPMPCGEA